MLHPKETNDESNIKEVGKAAVEKPPYNPTPAQARRRTDEDVY